MPAKALVMWAALASHALAAHSTKMNAPITIADTIVKTAARFRKKPTSMSRRLSAAYVSATGAVSNTRALTMPTTIVSAYDDEAVANNPMMNTQKNAASGTSVQTAR